MADSRKKKGERCSGEVDGERCAGKDGHEGPHLPADMGDRLGLAEQDLKFLFTIYEATCGLRSTLGHQLNAARMGTSSSGSVDPDAIVERMDDSVDDRRLARCVRARLAQTSDRSQRVLALALKARPLPGGLPAHAILSATAKESWGREVRQMAKRWTEGVGKGQRASEVLHHQRVAAVTGDADEVAAKVEALERTHAAVSTRKRFTADEVAVASTRWLGDEFLLAEHMKALSKVDRVVVMQECEHLYDRALASFAAQWCWPARSDAGPGPLSPRRCLRCGRRPQVAA